jgi:hypothetical protein
MQQTFTMKAWNERGRVSKNFRGFFIKLAFSLGIQNSFHKEKGYRLGTQAMNQHRVWSMVGRPPLLATDITGARPMATLAIDVGYGRGNEGELFDWMRGRGIEEDVKAIQFLVAVVTRGCGRWPERWRRCSLCHPAHSVVPRKKKAMLGLLGQGAEWACCCGEIKR